MDGNANDLEAQPSSTRHPGIDHVLSSDGLKSLAHPLRVRIYDELSAYGPLTASGGASSESCRHHASVSAIEISWQRFQSISAPPPFGFS